MNLDTPDEVLETICRNYWPAIYRALRAKGLDHEEAQDAAQEFVADFILGGSLHHVDAATTRLRAYMNQSLQNFLHRRHRAENCLKRGGSFKVIPLDEATGKDHPATPPPADQTYDLEWAFTLMQRALSILRQNYVSRGRGTLFDLIRPALTGIDLLRPYPAIAMASGLPEAQIALEVHRARRRLGEVLRHEVSATVVPGVTDAEVDDELRYVLTSLAHGR